VLELVGLLYLFKDNMLLKIKFREELIQQLQHQMILLEDNKESIVDRDQLLQIRLKFLLIVDLLRILVSQGKEAPTLTIRCHR
jgi:hypothetical protein